MTIEERPVPRIDTSSVKRMPGCSLLLLSSLLEVEGGRCRVALGTKLFHFGQVEVSRTVERTGEGEALMVVVARTVKAGEGWAPQWGVGMAGMRADVTAGWFALGAGGGIVAAMERLGRGALWVREWDKMKVLGSHDA